jgi:outer membrane immunogenic protein
MLRKVLGAAVVGASALMLPVPSAQADGPYTWTGTYFGINAGYTWNDADFSIVPTGLWAASPVAVANIQDATNRTLSFDGFTGGIQLGFNRQTGSLVWGIEADINGVSAETSHAGGAISGTTITGFTQFAELSWVATVRGRLGYAMNRTLVYATGGVAFGDWDVNMHMTSSGVDAVFHNSSIRTGWVVGAGVEHDLGNGLSLKGEYLYADFGDVTGTSAFPPPNFSGFSHDHSVDLTTHILRVGINAKF